MEMMIMEQELEGINLDLIRDAKEYGCGCLCPYSLYAAIEYGYIED